MAQTKIIPEFSFPYVKTVINDNTYNNTDNTNGNDENITRLVFPFRSSMGVDNKFVKITSTEELTNVFGESNYKLYGQPYMMPISSLTPAGNCEVWCMRVMPENATYAYKMLSIGYKKNIVKSVSYEVTDSSISDNSKLIVDDSGDCISLTDAKKKLSSVTDEDIDKYLVNGYLLTEDETTITNKKDSDGNPVFFVVPNETVILKTVSSITTSSNFKDELTSGLYLMEVSGSAGTFTNTVDDDGSTLITEEYINSNPGTYYYSIPDDYANSTYNYPVSSGYTTSAEISFAPGDYVIKTSYVIDREPTVYVEGSNKIIEDENEICIYLSNIKNKIDYNESVNYDGKYFNEIVSETPSVIDSSFDIKIVDSNDNTMDISNLISINGTDLADGSIASGLKDIFENTEPYTDEGGYTFKPLLLAYSSGRGEYGNNYRFKISQNTTYEKEYGIKMYNFSIFSTVGGLSTVTDPYVGSLVPTSKYDGTVCINDLLDGTDVINTPVIFYVDENTVADVYSEYNEFCKEMRNYIPSKEELETTTKYKNTYIRVNSGYDFALQVKNYDVKNLYSTHVSMSKVISSIPDIKENEYVATLYDYLNHLLVSTTDENLIDVDQFDPLLGKSVESTYNHPWLNITIDENSGNNYTSITGCSLDNGSDGYFDPDVKRPTDETSSDSKFRTINDIINNTTYFKNNKELLNNWNIDNEAELLYIQAFNGKLDSRILSSKRIQCNAWFDANYPLSVKKTMVDLAKVRGDSFVFLDTGIITSLSKNVVNSLINNYNFDDYIVSKNLHHYMFRETSTNKRVPVTITHFLAPAFVSHVATYGSHIPFVKNYCQLTGHIKDSLYPVIEDFDKELKDKLYKNRFNYFETTDDNVFQRGTQNTSQMGVSDLIEENNAHTLLLVKNMIEKDINSTLYNFADESVRNSLRSYEIARFAPWKGIRFESMDIKFAVSEWEAENSIIHAYLELVFRGLQKNAIVEININKRNYSEQLSTTIGY